MEDLVTSVKDGLGTAEAVAGGAVAWLSARFEWWKNSDSKLVKIGVPLGLFIGVALLLSLFN